MTARDQALAALGNQCRECEITDARVLRIKGAARLRRGRSREAYYLEVANNPEGCYLLCANCEIIMRPTRTEASSSGDILLVIDNDPNQTWAAVQKSKWCPTRLWILDPKDRVWAGTRDTGALDYCDVWPEFAEARKIQGIPVMGINYVTVHGTGYKLTTSNT